MKVKEVKFGPWLRARVGSQDREVKMRLLTLESLSGRAPAPPLIPQVDPSAESLVVLHRRVCLWLSLLF